MSNVESQPFDGSLNELSIYHIVIIESSIFVKIFKKHAEEIKNEILIRDFETDAACSWCVVECVKRAFPEIQVLAHELNDRYESIYDVFFSGEENDIKRKLLPYLQLKTQVKTLKVMPLLDKTLIAIGT